MRIPNLEKWKSKHWLKTRNIQSRERKFNNRVNQNRYMNYHQYLSAKNSLYVAKLRSKATRAELIFGNYLWENGIYFVFQKGLFKPFHRIFDFYLPQFNIAFEIDGDSHKETKGKDMLKDRTANERGIRTIRFKNEEIYDKSYIEKLKEIL